MRMCMSTCIRTSFLFHIHIQLSPCPYVYMWRLLYKTTYNINFPITIRPCVSADRGFARCLHTCDPLFNGLYFNIHTCLCFLWIHRYHVHRKNVHFCMHIPCPYLISATSSLSGSIPYLSVPSTSTRAHVCMFTPRLFNQKKIEYM